MRVALLLVGLLCACGARSAGDLLDGDVVSSGGGGAASGGKASFGGKPSLGGGPAAGGTPGFGGAPSQSGGSGFGGAPPTGGAPARGGGPSRGGAGGTPASGGAGSGGSPAAPDPVACSSLCTTIFSVCPIPEADRTTCTVSCVGDLQQQSGTCHELQRRAMTCVEMALAAPNASCDTVALTLAILCRDSLQRAAECRQ